MGGDDAGRAVADLTGLQPISVTPLGGGDSSAAFAVRCEQDTLFVKSAPGMPGALAAEAASLEWIAASGAVAVPRVHGHTADWLVTEHVTAGPPSTRAAEDLGRGLARLHRAGADAHGAAPPGGPADAWIGMAPMRNEPAADWPTFYAEHRITPYVRRAVDSGLLSTAEARSFDRVCARLDRVTAADEPPARLHGDLWSGNVHWGADGRAWLIDPAGHGGHRETDLAMLNLFGCPRLDTVLAAYQEVSPLEEGWRDRIGLHQLFPLLVHTVLFGRGYAVQAVAAARSVPA